MLNILQLHHVFSVFCPFSDWAGTRIKFYNIVIFTVNLIFLSALLKSATSENAIEVSNAICNLLITKNLNSMVGDK